MTISAIGIRRRLEALQALGYPAETLARDLGFHQLGATAIELLCQQPAMAAASADQVHKLYELRSGTPGPCQDTRAAAAAAGLAPPLAWDDDTIDDPTAEPVGVRTGPERHTAIDLSEVAWLRRFGICDTQIARQLGVRVKSIERAAHRATRRAELTNTAAALAAAEAGLEASA